MKKLHPQVKTHRCWSCTNMIREIELIGKILSPCNECGNFLVPLELKEQNKAWNNLKQIYK